MDAHSHARWASGARTESAAEMFGPYRVDSLLGRGGMGEVHRAFDTIRRRYVALKRLPPDFAADPTYQARFRREAALAATLHDPHVIPIHDYGEINGRLFLDMRLVEGVDLATVLERHGPLPAGRAVNVVSQVAGALDSAHAAGLVHRDVKPSNVLLVPTPGDDFAYLIDFGIARTTVDTTLTGTGQVVGTPAYMAPERFLHGAANAAADVYALGCLLFVALTGEPPFPGHDLAMLLYAHLNTPPPRLSDRRPDAPAGLDAVLARALAKDPAGRYPSAGAFAAEARAACDPPARGPADTRTAATVPAPRLPAEAPADPTTQAGAPRQRRAWRRAVPALVVVAALVGVVALVWPKHSIAVGNFPTSVAVAPDGSRVFVATHDSRGALSVVDVATGKHSIIDPGRATNTSGIGPNAQQVVVAPDGKRAYITYDYSSDVSVVDLANNAGAGVVVAKVSDGGLPVGVAVSPDSRTLFASTLVDLFVVDAASRATTDRIPAAGDLLFAPDGSRAYVAKGNKIAAVDARARRVVGTIDVGSRISEPVVAPDGRTLYVASEGVVQVVDTATLAVTTKIAAVASPVSELALSPDGRRLYVSDTASIGVVDTAGAASIGSIEVDAYVDDMAISPDGRRLYVISGSGDALEAVDTGTNQVVDIA
jgi:serine/threonine protein kinase, bacterial